MATIRCTGTSSSLAEVVERILDKGIVIDAWINVSLIGIDILTVEARIVVASVDTYLRYADAIGLTAQPADKGGMPALAAPVHQDAPPEATHGRSPGKTSGRAGKRRRRRVSPSGGGP